MPWRWCTASSVTTPAAPNGRRSPTTSSAGSHRPSRFAWQSAFDAFVELHLGNVAIALDRLAVDIDDPVTWWHAGQTMYRPWYAAVWAEAAVLARRDDAGDRVARARRATRDNPITAAMVERAAAIAAGDRPAVAELAATFAALGCPYQEERTNELAAIIGGQLRSPAASKAEAIHPCGRALIGAAHTRASTGAAHRDVADHARHRPR